MNLKSLLKKKKYLKMVQAKLIIYNNNNKSLDTIRFNFNNTKIKKLFDINESILYILGIKDYSNSVTIFESGSEKITSNKIKNKKD